MSRLGAGRFGNLILPHGALCDHGVYGDDISVESSGGSDSSAREYAEGLGCADRKACRARASGQFEFDRHPREEYFEEPRSHHAATVSDDDSVDSFTNTNSGPSPKRRRGEIARLHCSNAGACPSIRDVLAELERQESRDTQPRDRSEVIQRQLSVVARRCAQRGVQHERGVERHSAVSAPSDKTLATFCRELFSLRVAAASTFGAAERQKTLRLLKQLDGVSVDVGLLKSTGIGLELNCAFWRQNPCADIAKLSAALVKRWRKAVRPQLRARRSREGGG